MPPSREVHEEYLRGEAAGFVDNERPGRSVRRRRARRGSSRRGATGTYIAIVVLLALLIGGAYAAQVSGWIDFRAMLAGHGSLQLATDNGDGGQLVFSGKAGELAAPAGNLVQQDKSDSSVTWIRSSLREAGASGPTDGASVEIKPPLATDLLGKRIRVTMSARAPDQGTPAPFAAAYSSADAGTSGWIVFTPTKEFDDYSFDYQVPATVGTAQYIGIWSDISGRGAPLAVRSITVRRLD